MTTAHNEVDAYIDGFEGITRERLLAVRTLVRQAAPEATERISYKIIGYFAGKQSIVYVAGYAKHIGIYPLPAGDAAFRAELAPYAAAKSTARFPHTKPLPADLITQLVRFRLDELPSPTE